MTTTRGTKSDHQVSEAEKPSADEPEVTAAERPIWEIVAEIGAQIPEAEWERVPDDASINLKHYLYGAPRHER